MRFNRRLSPNTKVDLVPMIDVVFQLVVFFMVSTTFNLTPAITLDLPNSSSAEEVPVTLLTLSVISESEIYLNQEPFSLQTLETRLENYTEQERSDIQSVMLQGNKNVSYDLMVKVLDVLRNAGFNGVSLKTLVGEDP